MGKELIKIGNYSLKNISSLLLEYDYRNLNKMRYYKSNNLEGITEVEFHFEKISSNLILICVHKFYIDGEITVLEEPEVLRINREEFSRIRNKPTYL